MTGRVLLGDFPDGGVGLRCSKPGYGVHSNPPDPSQMVFDSSWGSVLPIHYMSGVFGLAPGQSTNIYYPTALSYYPFWQLIQSDDDNLWYQNPDMMTYNSLQNGYLESTAWTDHVYVYNNLTVDKFLFFTVFRYPT